jgi:uncharacterized protein YbjT (DUF2867 family)
VARALLVGCGCRGRELGSRLLQEGWQVRGTARREAGLAAIEAAGIDPVAADPDRVATVLDHIEGVTAIGWLLGSARGGPGKIAALHGARLERLCVELVDSPVRGVVYEAAGSVDPGRLREGERILRDAFERWRLRFEPVRQGPGEWRAWVDDTTDAFNRLVAG